jgi:hypothetical protein
MSVVFYCAGAVCLNALLRVPRPSASSFTYAKHSDRPLWGNWYSCVKAQFNMPQQRARYLNLPYLEYQIRTFKLQIMI